MSSWKNGRSSGKRRLKLFGLSVRWVTSYPAYPTAAVAPATVAAPTPTPTPRRNERRLYAAGTAPGCDTPTASTVAGAGGDVTTVAPSGTAPIRASLVSGRNAASPTETGSAG